MSFSKIVSHISYNHGTLDFSDALSNGFMRGGVFQSLDDCDDQVLSALRLLESRALKQVEKSTAQKQPRISNFFSPAVCTYRTVAN